MRHGQDLEYRQLTKAEKIERFTTNEKKNSIESFMQGIAHAHNCDMRKAISLTGPNIPNHQDKLMHYDFLYVPELNKMALEIMESAARGTRNKKHSNGMISFSRPKFGYNVPGKTIICPKCFFSVYKEDQDHCFGLVDFDACCAASRELKEKLFFILDTNTAKRWAFRICITSRNGDESSRSFMKSIEKYAEKSWKILHVAIRNYKEMIPGRNVGGAPMFMMQLIMENK